jgi:hypothetical protein
LDPAELIVRQLHKPVAGSKLLENFAFNHEGMRPSYVEEYGGQIFSPRRLRYLVDCHRYGPSICLPAPK